MIVPNNIYIAQDKKAEKYISIKVKQDRYQKQKSSASSGVVVGRDLEELLRGRINPGHKKMLKSSKRINSIYIILLFCYCCCCCSLFSLSF